MQKSINITGSAFYVCTLVNRIVGAARRTLRIESDCARSLLQGNALSNLGMMREAVKSYRKAVQSAPENVEALSLLGNALYKADMFKEAVETYKETARLRPDDAMIYYHLGSAYSKIGNTNAAIATTKRAVQIRPSMSGAHRNLGVYYGALGMYKEARVSFKHAVRLEPDNSSARYNHAIVCLELHDKDTAMEEYLILKASSPTIAKKLFKKIGSKVDSAALIDKAGQQITACSPASGMHF